MALLLRFMCASTQQPLSLKSMRNTPPLVCRGVGGVSHRAVYFKILLPHIGCDPVVVVPLLVAFVYNHVIAYSRDKYPKPLFRGRVK
jgi:hypothetical protein